MLNMHVYVVDYVCSDTCSVANYLSSNTCDCNKDQLCATPKNHVYVIFVVSLNIQQYFVVGFLKI